MNFVLVRRGSFFQRSLDPVPRKEDGGKGKSVNNRSERLALICESTHLRGGGQLPLFMIMQLRLIGKLGVS